MKIRNKLLLIIFVILILFGVIFYWFSQKQSEKYTGSVEKILLAGYAGETGALVYIAEEQGFFKKNGLDVEIKDYLSGKTAANALINEEADISVSADSVLVSNSFEQTDLRVIGTVATFENKELVARRDKEILIPTDLKGKKIGVTKKSGGEFALGVFLVNNDILQSEVEIIDLKPLAMLTAISSGEVDAVFTWDPNVYKIKQELGNNAISWPGQSDFYFLLLAKKDWLEKKPEIAERFLRAVMEAEDYVKRNSEKAKEFVKNRFNYNQDYIDYSWPKQKFALALPQSMILAFEDIARWRIKNNLTEATTIPNYLDYIYSNALEKVNPNAVSIIK